MEHLLLILKQINSKYTNGYHFIFLVVCTGNFLYNRSYAVFQLLLLGIVCIPVLTLSKQSVSFLSNFMNKNRN